MTKENFQGFGLLVTSIIIGFILSFSIINAFKDTMVYKLHAYTNVHNVSYDDDLSAYDVDADVDASTSGCGCASCCSVEQI